MANNNNVDNTNIQAIRTPIHSTMSNNCLKCGKSHAFHHEACPGFGSKCNTCGKANHWASVCLSNGTKPKQRPSREHKKPKSHNQPQPFKSNWILKQSHFKIKLNCQNFNPKIFQHWPYPWRTETQTGYTENVSW